MCFLTLASKLLPVPPPQAIANIVAQCGGACIGSLLLWGTSDLRRESSPVSPNSDPSCTAWYQPTRGPVYALKSSAPAQATAPLVFLCVPPHSPHVCNCRSGHLGPAAQWPGRSAPPSEPRFLPQTAHPAEAGLGANSVGEAYTVGNAVLGEIVCTFILVRWPLLPWCT